jgi:hypothetical protein
MKKIEKNKYKACILISDFGEFQINNQQRLKFTNLMMNFWKSGGGLMIFEDNDTKETSLSNLII